MHKRIGWSLVMIVGLMIGGCSLLPVDTSQCAGAISRIEDAERRGDLPIAKMLVDAALDDAYALGCDDEQCARLEEAYKRVYLAYIVERLIVAKDALIESNDGFVALAVIARVDAMAKEIGAIYKGADQFIGTAFLAAALQNIEAAEEAEEAGDVEEGIALREQAADFLLWACAFNPRIEKVLEESDEE